MGMSPKSAMLPEHNGQMSSRKFHRYFYGGRALTSACATAGAWSNTGYFSPVLLSLKGSTCAIFEFISK